MKFKEKGISLIEIILVAGVVIALTLLLTSLPSSMSSINKSRQTSLAKEIALKELERLRNQNYENLVEGSNSFIDADLNKLPSALGIYEIIPCSPLICTLDEDMKEIKVVVSWNESGDNKNVELSTLVLNGGLGQ